MRSQKAPSGGSSPDSCDHAGRVELDSNIESRDCSLTVAIPTYDRPKQLLRQLSCLAPQLECGAVEVLVCDNSPESTARSAIDATLKEHSGIPLRYVANGRNLGYDQNILECARQARGRHVWFLSDDDDVSSDAVQQVLQHLDREQPDLLILNSLDEGALEFTPTTASTASSPAERWDVLAKCVWVSRVVIRNSTAVKRGLGDLNGTRLAQLAMGNRALLAGSGQYSITECVIVTNHPHVMFSSGFLHAFLDGFYQFISHPESEFPLILARRVGAQNLRFLADARIRANRGQVYLNGPPSLWVELSRCWRYRAGLSLYLRFLAAHWISSTNRILGSAKVRTKFAGEHREARSDEDRSYTSL